MVVSFTTARAQSFNAYTCTREFYGWHSIGCRDPLLSSYLRPDMQRHRNAVKEGNKVFGAAILRMSDLSVVAVGTNAEMESPLWHGEVRPQSLRRLARYLFVSRKSAAVE